jgi:ElaA protein
MKNQLHWVNKLFNELSTKELYQVLQLREEVFIIEQSCIYLDLDQKDFHSLHVMGYLPNSDELVAYARLVQPGISYEEPSIGRVLTSKKHRDKRYGKELLSTCLSIMQQEYPQHSIKISAQTYLIAFYQQFGFKTIGSPYDEDGIEHIEMLKTAY